MIKEIIFVCHGNICRSPVAEIVFNELIARSSLKGRYFASSYALSSEEIGNDIYPPMKRVLLSKGLTGNHYAQRLTKEDVARASHIFYMDNSNEYLIRRYFPNDLDKFSFISKYTDYINEIEDPWYSGRYIKVFEEIQNCVKDIIFALENEEK